ncbi:UDP-2,3-diacylglucosamine diphosphatase [Pontibacter sp. BT310]|uniref:UDP-2,3-diacylglucosamine diphosphatase n=1 Tax=Pontibacter populi TaxID=890055 RepID=A0ABS6X7U5_9BACT|nr:MULTISPECIES: UDP-2,3-diacylglucosamine diphosphatase [Pontibacter]MBJ6117088.1 UDP-2,3-diacylglucosamine diphosphatase [Pontibacter sp. BT310]MBR0569512.1 UDP-2,3-diacylglucosamine diphosphatase [Microvirga sp. STS03]MBW3363941.1 UDP-2,3-diacylglucosamine diphosphatase [Pontibacter populi]
MTFRIDQLAPGKKVYFASDFHLGVPDAATSKARELKIVRWLDEVKHDAAAILLLGDIFDFWFEYRHTIPKGFIRLQGKLAEITDSGIPVLFFTGNHDMWMFDYFPTELNIPVLREPISTTINGHTFYIGHGDGLGPGDHTYKIIKKVFANKACQWAFARIHPNLGIGIANMWSRKSRISNVKKDESFLGEDEWLLQYCREVEADKHHDYYIFGHRHLPLDLPIGEKSRYVNLGEWVNFCSYGVYDGANLTLEHFEA